MTKKSPACWLLDRAVTVPKRGGGQLISSGLVVAVAFVDFKKAFDSVCHTVLETKLQRDFGISGPLLDWLKSYLKGRQQVTIVNGVNSRTLPVPYGIPNKGHFWGLRFLQCLRTTYQRL